MKALPLLLCSIFLVISSGCEKRVINHGYVLREADFKKIVVGKHTAMEVYGILGSPTVRSSVISEDGSFSWYYVTKRAEKRGGLSPRVVFQKTMVIRFTKDGIVKAVNSSTFEQKVRTVSDETVSKGKTGSLVQETFGGLGKYMNRFKDAEKKKKS